MKREKRTQEPEKETARPPTKYSPLLPYQLACEMQKTEAENDDENDDSR